MMISPTYIKKYLLRIAPLALFACAGPPEHKPIDTSLFEYETIEESGHKLHVARSGNPGKTPIIMIHGTPGSWKSYSDLMQNNIMQKNYALYAIDRLGWGKSVSANNTVEAGFEPHTNSIDALLKKIYADTGKKSIIVGHSLGASLAPMVAIASPAYVKGVVVIAGDLDPRFGEPRWYNSLADLWLIKKLLPKNLAKANDEIMPLKKELINMNRRFNEINVPVTIIHGTDDALVSYENVAYAKQALQHLSSKLRIISLQNAGHFVIWEYIPTIVTAIKAIDTQK